MNLKNKKWFFFFAVLVFSAVGFWSWNTLVNIDPAKALPDMGEEKSFAVIGIDTPKMWSERLAQLEELVKEWEPIKFKIPEIAEKSARLFPFITKGALMAYPGEDGTPHIIGAFIPDVKTLKNLDAESQGGDAQLSPWDSGGRGKQGWILSYPALQLKVYLVLHRTFPKPLLLAALEPADLDRAIAALKSSSDRLKIKNKNAAPDYLLARVPAIGTKDKRVMATVNLAWVEDETSAHLQVYSDMLTLRHKGERPWSNSGKADLPLLGDGDLSLVFASDLAFLCELAFFDSPDPVKQALQYASFFIGGSEQQMQEWETLVRNMRLSAVATLPREGERDPEKGASYLVFESKKEAKRLQATAKGFASRMAAVELKGWDWMHQMRMGVLGGRGDIVLLGMGKPDSFAVKATIPQELKEFAAPTDLLSFIALVNEKTMNEFLIPFGRWGKMPTDGIKKIALDGGGSIHLRVTSHERADLGIYWKD